MDTSAARKVTRAVLIVFASLGTLCFGGACLATVVVRPQIEQVAQEYLRAEVTRRAQERFGAAGPAVASALHGAQLLGKSLSNQAASMKSLSDSRWPELVGGIIASLCDVDCEEEKEAASTVAAGGVRDLLAAGVQALADKVDGLRDFVIGAYKERLQALIDELRLFTGINAVAFALTLALLWFARRNMKPVLLPAFVLLLSTATSVGLYVTTQDWFWNILLGDYMGAWYAVILGGTLVFFADIVLFKARLTEGILSALPTSLVPPC